MSRLFVDICPQFSSLLLQKCYAIGIKTVTDFITNDCEDLAKKLDTPYRDILSIHRSLIMKYSSLPQNARSMHYELLESISILNTGSKRVNSFLNGGIYTGEITEIYGLPGSGKTQFCMSLVSNLIMMSNSSALYLDTSSNFTAKRIEQILKLKSKKNLTTLNKMNNIKVKYIYDIYDLLDCIDTIKTELKKKENSFFLYLKVLVIDAITFLISPCFDGKYLDGLYLMSNVCQMLKTLAWECKISILICNNTVTSKDTNIKPALGQHWKTIPSVSLCVNKVKDTSQYKMKTTKSCRTGTSKEIIFNINETGIAD